MLTTEKIVEKNPFTKSVFNFSKSDVFKFIEIREK